MLLGAATFVVRIRLGLGVAPVVMVVFLLVVAFVLTYVIIITIIIMCFNVHTIAPACINNLIRACSHIGYASFQRPESIINKDPVNHSIFAISYD